MRRWAVGILGVAFVGGWYSGDLSPTTVTTKTAAIAVAFVLLGAVAASRVTVSVKTDSRSGQVETARLAMSRWSASVIMASATAIGGFDAMWEIAPVAIALAVVATVSLMPILRRPTTDGLKPRSATDKSIS